MLTFSLVVFAACIVLLLVFSILTLPFALCACMVATCKGRSGGAAAGRMLNTVFYWLIVFSLTFFSIIGEALTPTLALTLVPPRVLLGRRGSHWRARGPLP